MNFERYTEKLKQAIQLSQSLAIAGQNQFITPLHLFSAIEQDEDKLIPQLISASGGNFDLISQDINERLERLPKVSGDGVSQPTITSA